MCAFNLQGGKLCFNDGGLVLIRIASFLRLAVVGEGNSKKESKRKLHVLCILCIIMMKGTLKTRRLAEKKQEVGNEPSTHERRMHSYHHTSGIMWCWLIFCEM